MSTLFLKPTERNKQDMESLGMFFIFYGGQQCRMGCEPANTGPRQWVSHDPVTSGRFGQHPQDSEHQDRVLFKEATQLPRSGRVWLLQATSAS